MNLDNYNELIQKIKNNDERLLLEGVIIKINQINENLEEWNKENLEQFLNNQHSVSVNSLQKYLSYYKKIHKFYCNKNNIKFKEIKLDKNIKEFMDFEKLRQQVITYDDYIFIRNQLNNEKSINVRDKVIFELAWEGLTASEIVNLKHQDIDFINGKVKVGLEKRIVWIEDPIVIEDIKLVMKEIEYYRIDKNGKVLIYQYKWSDYLIKPIAIRTDATDNQIVKIANVFNSIARRLTLNTSRRSQDYDGTEHIIDLDSLSVANIRRSKIVWLLSQPKSRVIDIAGMLNKNQSIDLYWLKQISKKIYKQ